MKMLLAYLLVVMISLSELCLSSSQIYLVRPSASSSGACPKMATIRACKTLQEYTRDHDFPDNSILQFLQGEHQLSTILNITGVKNLSLTGLATTSNSHPMIECQGKHSGLVFINCTNVSVANLLLSRCGGDGRSHTDIPAAALYYGNVVDISIVDVSLERSQRFGLDCERCCGLTNITRAHFDGSKGQPRKYTGGNARFLFVGCANISAILTIRASEFVNGKFKKYTSGISIHSTTPGVKIDLDNVTLRNNKGGNLNLTMKDFVDQHWQISITNSRIEHGYNYFSGGGVFFMSRWHNNSFRSCKSGDGNKLEFLNTNFTRNRAGKYGGALSVKLYVSDCMPSETQLIKCWFDGNSVSRGGHGSAINVVKGTLPAFYQHNSTSRFPLHNFHIVSSHFLNNHISGTQASVMELLSVKKVLVTNSTFCDNIGTAISMTSSTAIFTGDLLFAGNSALNGGALKFCETSMMFFNNVTNMHFVGNHANNTGGAIYAQESCQDQPSPCFFQPNIYHKTMAPVSIADLRNIKLSFVNNTADTAGDSVYGGKIDYCFTYERLTSKSNSTGHYYSKEVFEKLTDFKPGDKYGDVSSEPYQVLLCDHNGRPTDEPEPVRVVPGKSFNISVAAAGQHYGIAPAIITAELDPETADSASLQMDPFIPSNSCTNLTMRVLIRPEIVQQTSLVLNVKVQHPSSYKVSGEDYIRNASLVIEPCPWGFSLSCPSGYCECDCAYYKNSKCDLKDSTVHRSRVNGLRSWVGCVNNDSQTNYSCEGKNFLYAYGCGREGYCLDDHDHLDISEKNIDYQCSPNRTGILCGSCVRGYSVVLGTGKCKMCPESNAFVSLIVVYLAAGILLVVVLTKFKLTITSGSLNGLIFYANIIHWNRHSLFPHFHNYDILRLVIAWLNLDLGIEVCFFDGMTAYHSIWLQIGYIVYISSLQMIIIVLCRRYVAFTQFFGRNVTKVMSTLVILLFYKTLRTTIDIIQLTYIRIIPNEKRYLVLSIDGNIRYWSHEHIPLVTIAVLLSIFLALITFSLLFIQILMKASGLRCFKWVARLQPFFETITGPCNEHFLFWPGFLFLIRFMGYVSLFSFRLYGRNQLYLSATAAAFLIIFSFLGPKGVYKKWSLNILEFSFLLNLTLTCTVCVHIGDIAKSVLSHISIGVALLIFFFYHVKMHLLFKRAFKFLYKKFAQCCRRSYRPRRKATAAAVSHTEVTIDSSDERTPILHPAQIMPPVASYGKLRETLLENDNCGSCH